MTDSQIIKIVSESALEKTESQSIIERFGKYESIAKEWEVKAKSLVVTDVTQTTEMAMAKEARKKFSQMRIDVERARKEMKEQSLRKGQAIDAIARFITSLISPIELYLLAQEDFVKIKLAKEAEELRIKAEQEAEEARLLKEKQEEEERERIRLDNIRLQKEAVEREKVLEMERQKRLAELAEAENKLNAERVEREKVQASLKAEQDKLANKIREEEERESLRLMEIEEKKKREAKSSDNEKYREYILNLKSVIVPQVKDEEMRTKLNKITDFLNRQLI